MGNWRSGSLWTQRLGWRTCGSCCETRCMAEWRRLSIGFWQKRCAERRTCELGCCRFLRWWIFRIRGTAAPPRFSGLWFFVYPHRNSLCRVRAIPACLRQCYAKQPWERNRRILHTYSGRELHAGRVGRTTAVTTRHACDRPCVWVRSLSCSMLPAFDWKGVSTRNNASTCGTTWVVSQTHLWCWYRRRCL